MTDVVNHPPHYGGDTPYEAIKVIEAWELGFNLGNAVKYIARADHKGTPVVDLEKARWYLDREIERRKIAAAKDAVKMSPGAFMEVGPIEVAAPDVAYAICGKTGANGKCVFSISHQSICRNANGLGIS